MGKTKENKGFSPPPARIGVFTKSEAATQLQAGVCNLHSSPLGDRDPLYKLTLAALGKSEVAAYPWELVSGCRVAQLDKSKSRTAVIEKLTEFPAHVMSNSLKEAVRTVFEELVSNALYHAYRTPTGQEKYQRDQEVALRSEEVLELSVNANRDGVYICVADQAGTLDMGNIASTLTRCYHAKDMIEKKRAGAGIGLYMAFEMATHMKVETSPGKQTKVCCWVASNRHHEPKHFSFNFFKVGGI